MGKYYNGGQTFTIEGKNVLFEYGLLGDAPYISIKETYTDKDGKTKINYKTGIFQVLNDYVVRTSLKALLQNVSKDKKEHELKLTRYGNKAVILIINATPNSIAMSLREYSQNGATELNSKDYSVDFREGNSDSIIEFDGKKVYPVIESLISYMDNLEKFIVDLKTKLKLKNDLDYAKRKDQNNPKEEKTPEKGEADDSDYIPPPEVSKTTPEIAEDDDIPF